jgi:putative DNA primase/helicase
MPNVKSKMLESFSNHKYRYIDQTGNGRPPVSSATLRPDLNENGFEAYFTVNGFKDANANTKEQCINLNSFFVDIDGRKDLAELEIIKKKLDPTFITETKNGYHVFWLLDEVIYKEDLTPEEWAGAVLLWEKLEQSIVDNLKADPAVKDITRILRIPETFYWKKSGDAYKKGTKDIFKIKGVYKNLASNYSMAQVEEAFPIKKEALLSKADLKREDIKHYTENERNEFYVRINEIFPIEERESFQKLISGAPGTLPEEVGIRNVALLITASLMRQANWTKEKALKNFESVGWHGMEKERGGWQEILTTVSSAFRNGYTYSYKNKIIDWNMSGVEEQKMMQAFMVVFKEREKKDKIRYSTYENEIIARHPNLRKNEIGMVFDYFNGVYKSITDLEISNIIFNSLYEDMLWNFRTKKHVSDKMACLIAIIPYLKITDDSGVIANVKNGLLNIYTKELKPHTPNFVSLIQYPVTYDPGAKCPVWERCLEAWMSGPEIEEKKILLQQFSGYLLSSSMLYDKAMFLIGDGGNGKSTFVDTLAMAIGHDSTSHIDLESLYSNFGMHGLIGKRLNVIEEVHGNYYQSNKLKKLISGEKITIDIKYKPQFSFRPQVKFIFAVNIMPRVDDTSTATERRICAVIFRNNFRDNPNTELRSDTGLLAQELSGIFNWMLEGVKILKEKKNFIITKEQTSLLSEYRQENSSVEGFIGECLVFEEGRTISSRELYEEYKEYCFKDGRKFKGSIGFSKEMKAYGQRYNKFQLIPRDSGKGSAYFEGVFIDPTWSEGSNVHQNRLNREF